MSGCTRVLKCLWLRAERAESWRRSVRVCARRGGGEGEARTGSRIRARTEAAGREGGERGGGRWRKRRRRRRRKWLSVAGGIKSSQTRPENCIQEGSDRRQMEKGERYTGLETSRKRAGGGGWRGSGGEECKDTGRGRGGGKQHRAHGAGVLSSTYAPVRTPPPPFHFILAFACAAFSFPFLYPYEPKPLPLLASWGNHQFHSCKRGAGLDLAAF